MLHETYLPFSKEVFKEHFIRSSKDLESIDKHIKRYEASIENYKFYETKQKLNNIENIRQIEKDETFWTASSLMTIFYSNKRSFELQRLLTKAFGEEPPLDNFSCWEDCLDGELKLFFEPNLPSPEEYLMWLKENVMEQNFIPYIIEKAKNEKGGFRSNLEGPTNIDALLINSTNGFAVLIEAKVLSDISYETINNSMRNQIIRNIDVMLSSNSGLAKPLNKRKPENSLFSLLTPELFRKNCKSRLYGYVFKEYKTNPEQIRIDLPHRKLDKEKCEKISKRIGWITWEDLKSVNNDCCKWIKTK